MSLANAATYSLQGPHWPWLWPALEMCGLALQLLAIIRRKPLALLAGFGVLFTGAWVERDIALAVGDLVICLGLLWCK